MPGTIIGAGVTRLNKPWSLPFFAKWREKISRAAIQIQRSVILTSVYTGSGTMLHRPRWHRVCLQSPHKGLFPDRAAVFWVTWCHHCSSLLPSWPLHREGGKLAKWVRFSPAGVYIWRQRESQLFGCKDRNGGDNKKWLRSRVEGSPGGTGCKQKS